ncbi:hypothetical protein METP1_02507 [Methanosarcinales archaeon]|nr:hypothetical protein METP1_02507 [Methanosarcinales archaeon]
MINRREFIAWLAAAFLFIISGCIYRKDPVSEISNEEGTRMKRGVISKVYVLKTNERSSGIKELLKYFDTDKYSGKKVSLKANFNSDDPFPASTHPDTISVIVDSLREKGASIIIAERSGMGNTRKTLEDLGIMNLSKNHGFDVLILDDLKKNEWIYETPVNSHWKRGFLFPKLFRDADFIIQTCCLKTHRFGGHFTMSLKNSVGMVAKYDPEDDYNYMSELHSSKYQRQMIAEINTAYEPDIIIMDGISGFSKGGPDEGTLIEPGIMIASNDRIAIDAVGVATLRIYGTTGEVERGSIFEQEQIARAVELGIGASGAEKIEIIAINNEAREICESIRKKLNMVS